MEDNELAGQEQETCSNCLLPEDDCECSTCGICEHRVDSTCSRCRDCEDCCECSRCTNCWEPCESTCSNCSRCTDCCVCSYCEGCESNVYRTCGECDRCSDCCSCDEESDRTVELLDNSLKFHKGAPSKQNPSKRFVAMEIEVSDVTTDGGTYDAVDKWNGSIVEDGSLPDTGFEINTAPASGKAFIEQIDDICGALSTAGAEVSTICGLHVHVDARDYTYYDIRRLVQLYAKIEDSLFSIVATSRQDNHYCAPCGKRYAQWIGQSKTPKDTKCNIFQSVYGEAPTRHLNKKRGSTHSKYNSARYSALNIHSWFFRGTIECRMHHGTVSARNIKHWGILWAAILDFAMSATEAKIAKMPEGMEALLAVAKHIPETHAWIVSRALFFARRRHVSGVPGMSVYALEVLQNLPSEVTPLGLTMTVRTNESEIE